MLAMLIVLGFMPTFIEKKVTIVMLVTGISAADSQSVKYSGLLR
jgi:uncharacterized membrane protein YphA (DoxX/SURF4 family)